jgi:hypothetical protein
VLVVSALDSVQAGTGESLTSARGAGIVRVAVALTKCDLVEDPELLDLVTMEVREMLNKNECSGDAAPVVRVAARWEGAGTEGGRGRSGCSFTTSRRGYPETRRCRDGHGTAPVLQSGDTRRRPEP